MGENQDLDRGDDFADAGDAGGDDEAARLAAEAAAKGDEKVETLEEKVAREKADREKDIKIPKAEFDRRLAAERTARDAAEKRAKDLEDQAASRVQAIDVAKLNTELEELEEKLDVAMADNNPAEKKLIRAAIRAKQDEISDARMAAHSAYASALAVEQTRYDNAVAKLESDYPFLDQDNEETLDKELLGTVVDLKQAYEASGLPSSAALKKALKTLSPQLAAKAESLKPKKKADEKDLPKDDGKKDDPKAAVEAAEKAAKLRADAVTKGLEAKGKQPAAKTDAVGKPDVSGRVVSVKKMSQKDFDKLDAESLSALRGDNV